MDKAFSSTAFFNLLLLVALLLNGCGAKNIGTEYTLDDAKGAGIVVASLTQAGLQSSFNMFVDLRHIGSNLW